MIKRQWGGFTRQLNLIEGILLVQIYQNNWRYAFHFLCSFFLFLCFYCCFCVCSWLVVLFVFVLGLSFCLFLLCFVFCFVVFISFLLCLFVFCLCLAKDGNIKLFLFCKIVQLMQRLKMNIFACFSVWQYASWACHGVFYHEV